MNLNKVHKFYRQTEKERQLKKTNFKEKINKIDDQDKFVKFKNFLLQGETQSPRQSILSRTEKASSILRSSSLHTFQSRPLKPLFFGMNQRQFLNLYINDPFARQKIKYTIQSQMKNLSKKKVSKTEDEKKGGVLRAISNSNNIQLPKKLKITQNCQQINQKHEDLTRTFRRVCSLKKIEEVQEINYYQNLLISTKLRLE